MRLRPSRARGSYARREAFETAPQCAKPMRATAALLGVLSLAASARAQNDNIDSNSAGGRQGVEHGTGQACVCRTADCTGLEPTDTNGCPPLDPAHPERDGKNRWLPDMGDHINIQHGCPDGVLECPCESAVGDYIDAGTKEECVGRTQGLTDAQVAKMVANGVDPAKHECGCCHCNAIAGGGTGLKKECDELDEEAWDPNVHACSSTFWIVVFVIFTLVGGGAAGVFLTKRKKEQMAEKNAQDKATLDEWDKSKESGDGDVDDA